MRQCILAVLFLCTAAKAAFAVGCVPGEQPLATSRHVQIDASAGPVFGAITRYAREPSFLRPKEVVLTFDDGPSPRLTRSILRTLDTFCAKATFFLVGRMAVAYPDIVRDIASHGHTIGAHTWSHPYNLRRLDKPAIAQQVEKGFAAISLAAGRPIAPFFRFPGLNDDGRALAYLQQRGVATFSVDVVSDDSYINEVGRLVQTTLSRVEAQQGGILLFHDIKSTTEQALPRILAGLRDRGYSLVHLTSKFAFTPQGNYEREFAALLKERTSEPVVSVSLRGLQGTVRPSPAHLSAPPPVTFVAPQRKTVELAKTRDARLETLGKSITLRGWKSLIEGERDEPVPVQ